MSEDVEITTSELAKLAGVEPYLIRKWKMRGDLKLAPTGYVGQGRGNEMRWPHDAVQEVLERAREHRTTAHRRAKGAHHG